MSIIVRSEIIGTTAGYRESMLAREENALLEKQLERRRKKWKLKPPTDMTVTLHASAGSLPAGLVLSVPHDVGRMLLHKRLAAIVERDLVTIDAVIDGTLEDAVEAMGLGAAGAAI